MILPLWFRAVLRRDLLLLRDAPWAMVLSLAATMLGVLVFGLLGRFVGRGPDYIAFIVTGIAFLRVIDAVVHAPGQGLRDERSRGSLEVLLDAPRRPWALVLASGVVPAVRSLLEGAISLGVAAALFEAELGPGWIGLITVPLAVTTALLLALATGLFFAAAGMQSRAATAASTFFALAVAMTSGVYFPRSALPVWLQQLSAISPFTPALNTVRASLTHRGSFLSDLAFAGAAAGLLLVAGALLMNRAVRRSRMTGALARG